MAIGTVLVIIVMIGNSLTVIKLNDSHIQPR